MRSDLLHVVTARYNPLRWQTPHNIYTDFEQAVLDAGAQLTVVECAFGERPFLLDDRPHVNHVGVRSRSIVWNKENLINIGVSRLPADWKYLMWSDSDVFWRKSGWASEVVHTLQHYAVIQPWDTCYDLGPNDDHLQAHRSFCKLYFDGKPLMNGTPGYEFAHPGYAWAMRRDEYVRVGRLLECGAAGAGDHHMALALVGKAKISLPYNISDSYRDIVMRWQDRAVQHVNYSIGYMPGTIEHKFHGSKVNRKYISRWPILTGNRFDPVVDLKYNEWGVVELTGNKPNLTLQLDQYFRQRNEDANVVT